MSEWCPSCGDPLTAHGGHRTGQAEMACFNALRVKLAAAEQSARRRRDAFAAAALTGLLAAPADAIRLGDVANGQAAMCRLAFEFADGMIDAAEPS